MKIRNQHSHHHVSVVSVAVLCFVILAFPGCGSRQGKELKTVPGQPGFPGEEYKESIRQGDENFAKSHLYGWRKAEEFYARAYVLKKTPDLRDKRFLALCLTAIREKHEQIVNPAVYEKLEALGEFDKNQKQQYIWDIVQHLRSLPVPRTPAFNPKSNEYKEVDVTFFDLENSALDAYLFLYCSSYYRGPRENGGEDLTPFFRKYRVNELLQKYEMSPLFIYFNLKAALNREQEIEALYPDFAEFLLFKGDTLFSKKKLKQASGYYEKALQLIPDYPRAINGIGNIYFFTINDYEKAIGYYQRTLDLDPLNPVALFGKGVSLHRLDRYDESDQVFDVMLAKQDMYLGEAYYYKAYNRYFMKDMETSRRLVESAKIKLPRSGEVLFLSGLLYYGEEKLEAAEEDFGDALFDREYSPCYPLYYLGMIAVKKQKWSFLEDFADSIRCFREAEESMKQHIEEIDTLEIEEYQKEWMKQRQAERLREFSESAGQLIQQMSASIAMNKDKKKEYDKKKENAEVERVKALLEKNPTRIDKQDEKDEGSTLLHKAVTSGNLPLVRFLLSKGAYVDIEDYNSYTPLNWAVLLGNKEIIRQLIVNGANVNRQNIHGMTPLHDAATNGKEEIVRLLLAKGANPAVPDENGMIPMDMAVQQKHTAVYPLLKPLHMAVVNGDIDRVKDIIKLYPALVAARDEKGKTPLHLAVEIGNEAIAALLLDHQAGVNARDFNGVTPLETARTTGHDNLVQLLIKRGAAPTDDEMMKRELQEKEAVLWYLGNGGWGIKTKNHFLVFDYQAERFNYNNRATSERLATGRLKADELKGQKVTAFISSYHLDAPAMGLIYDLEQRLPDIVYIARERFKEKENHIVIRPSEVLHREGMEIVAIESAGDDKRLAFLVKVDGVTLFYAGSHGCWREEMWDTYTAGIDFLEGHLQGNDDQGVGRGCRIDVAFLPIPGTGSNMTQEEREVFIKGTRYAVEKLGIGVAFTLEEEGDEFFGDRCEKSMFIKLTQLKSGPWLFCPQRRGERYFFKDGEIKEHR